eukprot:gnl/Dysnectes_brevis/702_a774_2119.p1 GENE.gnl/Dysnectes_brevis/702_a774_2119~~gnl/Dysnectes_brevis/702_a774_2119.p1  ORF type:complete len:1078 (-),score=398.14 gnl/Dysnectes_brevis/702_a774_2119:1756-4989(-)
MLGQRFSSICSESNVFDSLDIVFDRLPSEVTIRNEVTKKIDIKQTVARLHTIFQSKITNTPLFHYDLLSQEVSAQAYLKLENLQRLGDISLRGIAGVIGCNMLHQGKQSLDEIESVCIYLDPSAPSVFSAFEQIAVVAAHLGVTTHVFVPHTIDIRTLYQLQVASLVDFKSHIHPDGQTKQAAIEYASQNPAVLIAPEFYAEYASLGLMSCVASILSEMDSRDKPIDTIVIPYRDLESSWSTLAASAYYIRNAARNPRRMRIAATRLSPDTQSHLFSAQIARGWIANRNDQATVESVFSNWSRDGHLDAECLQQAVSSLVPGCRVAGVAPTMLALTLPQFHAVLKQQLTSVGRAWAATTRAEGRPLDCLSLESLLSSEYVSQLIDVTEDDLVIAFTKNMSYTNSHVSGLAATGLAALFSGKITVSPNENVVVLLSAGTVQISTFGDTIRRGLHLLGLHSTVRVLVGREGAAQSNLLGIFSSRGIEVIKTWINIDARDIPVGKVEMTLTYRAPSSPAEHELLHQLEEEGYYSMPHHAFHRHMADPQVSYQHVPRLSSTEFEGPSTAFKSITPESIRAARDRIAPNLYETPIYRSAWYSRHAGCNVHLMLESLQRTGAFKIRGSSNKLIYTMNHSDPARPCPGVVASSAGNHAQGVAYAAQQLGLPCTIFCPTYAPDTKLSKTRRYKAEVIKEGDSFDQTSVVAEQTARERGWMRVHPFRDPLVIEGQGTIAVDIERAVPNVDTIIVAVGGGGMISGISLYFKQLRRACGRRVRIVGVQAEKVGPLCGSGPGSFKESGRINYVAPAEQTIADGTNVKFPGGPLHTSVLYHLVDEFIAIPENEIAATILHALRHTRTVVEGAGAMGLAAILFKHVRVSPNENVAIVMCGGNIDLPRMLDTYQLGTRALGRSLTIEAEVQSGPGQLNPFLDAAARHSLRLLHVVSRRCTDSIKYWDAVQLQLTFWASSFKDQNRFLTYLLSKGIVSHVMGRSSIDGSGGEPSHFSEYDEAREAFLQRRQEVHATRKQDFEARGAQLFEAGNRDFQWVKDIATTHDAAHPIELTPAPTPSGSGSSTPQRILL